MTKLFATVTGAGAVVEKIGKLTTGMVGVPVACSFDESWDSLNRLAVFRCGEVKKDNALQDDDTQVPHEVLTQPGQMLYIGFEGRSKAGDVVIPTIWAEAGYVLQGAQAADDPSLAPTPSQFDRFMEELAQAEERVQKAVATPNWNAQEGEAGYIANRPFGEKTAITQLLPMTTVTHFGSANDADLPTFQILPGETYLVNFNGAEYELVAVGFPNNTGAFVGDMLRQNLPFAIVYTYADQQHDAMTWINVAEGITEAALAVSHKQILEIQKLDPKYLPDSIGPGGADGFSPTARVQQTDAGAVITVTDKNGTTTATVTNGKDGKDGRNGTDGKDGAPGAKGDKGDTGEKGEKGDTGAQGEPGKDGFSPEVDLAQTSGGVIVTITTEGGAHSATIHHGKDGADGQPGKDGADGVSVKHSWSGTVLTVTSANGTSSSDLKGDKGDQGIQGEPGAKGDKGDKGDQGIQGEPGAKGDKGDKGDQGIQGEPGAKGEKGDKGDQGIQGEPGAKGDKGDKGDQGIPGEKGEKGDPGGDYVLTDADRDTMVAQIQAKANQQTPLFANSQADCTDTSKVYVLPDGYLYGYIRKEGTYPAITYESKSDGYWGWDATNSRFLATTSSGWKAKLTNKIPVTPGDQLSYKGKMQYSGNRSYAWFNASGKAIDSGTLNSESSPTVLTAPDGAASVQFTSFSQSTVILEVEWVLCQAAAPTYRWASTGHAFVPADYESRILALESAAGETTSVLKGKKIVYDGDSICESRTGSTANNGGGYAKLIADRVGGSYVNQAVGGARLTTKPADKTYHSVVDNLPNLPTDGDLYCFEGGINDYWTPKALGSFSQTDFTGSLDTNTICGALETIFRYALTNFVGKPICFVITHKIQSTAYAKNTNGDTFADYRNAMVGICNKYSIPYYDAFSESGLNGWNTAQNNAYLTSNTGGTADGIHPNAEGYKRYYVPQLIRLFERIMPVA